MFFWIKGDVNLSDSEQLEAVENLGESGFAGRHLVLADRSTIESISGSGALSRKASAYYRSVRAKYAQVAGVQRSVRKFWVSADCYSPILNGEWTVPLNSFRTDDSVERLLLLVEHMYDYKVIQGLSNIFLKELGVAAWIRLALTPVSGGGGGTSLTLSVHQKNMRSLGLCIVDSDRQHVKGATGSTAKGCSGVYDNRWGWSLHVLGARELENLVPPQLYSSSGIDIPIGDGGNYNSESWPIYGFADTKKGDCLCRFRNLAATDLSYRETLAALAHFSESDGSACPSRNCKLSSGNENALIALSANFEKHPLAAQRTLPSKVQALTELLGEVVSFAAAANWKIT
ncbi:hypothetical protein [Stenotrophomonas maltophilia]|uniref:hypothetical protein n=1 Tax=Stenotrophomonas maltophilia TaxID=40324 RepID=UPI001C98F3B2|nr:hypothetical protein [Stenotrophomonas maltophilia]MBY6279025.1 hypothetical protein [Stenotrophomonas maltophilia]